jgi:NAD+ diphosphatase
MVFVPAVHPTSAVTTSAWCFGFVDGRLLLPEPEGRALQPEPLHLLHGLAESAHYLGRLDEFDCWALRLPAAPPGWRSVPLRSAMMQMPAPLTSVAGRAAQVLEWERAHRHCGVCGTPTLPHEHDRARVCPACGHVAYPRLSPAMMALVWRDQELLLARAPTYSAGMYSALAGFVEAGESIEDCVVREVAEEVGVAVKNLRYYGSQSWPFPHSLMVAYTAEWAGGEIVPQPSEIESAGWFGIDELPGIPPRFSIAGHLIRDTVDALRSGMLAHASTIALQDPRA